MPDERDMETTEIVPMWAYLHTAQYQSDLVRARRVEEPAVSMMGQTSTFLPSSAAPLKEQFQLSWAATGKKQ